MNRIRLVKTKLSTWVKLLTIELIAAIMLFMAAIFLFAFIANEVVIEKEIAFDVKVFHVVSSYTSPTMTSAALLITFLGSAYFLIPLYLVIISIFIKNRNYHYAIMVAVVSLISMLSGFILKEIFHRARPLVPLVEASGFSFPSGHSLAGFTFTGLMIYIAYRSNLPAYLKWIVSFILLVLGMCIALSRIYLHVHFPSDVVGSLFVTIAWLSVCFMIFQGVTRRKSTDTPLPPLPNPSLKERG